MHHFLLFLETKIKIPIARKELSQLAMGTQLFLFMGRVGPEQGSKPLIMLTKQALEEYKQLHREETGTVLPDDVLANEAINLLTLFNFVYRPIKKEWLKEYGRQNKTERGMDKNSKSKRKVTDTSGEVPRIQKDTPRSL